ncbi:TonB-dependent receptor [Aurantiacibacter marinus]|nr:TonB-dependent receptor [Aurantiacibacter marinus]
MTTIAGLAATGVFQSSAACAQDTVIATGEALADTIIVTAQGRDENLQDVPLALTKLTEEMLVARDIRSLQDLNGVVPGFVTTSTVGYSAAPLSIRGIGGANGGGNVFNDEPVAVYVDGVYIARLSFPTADLLDVGSIQVLRGPQGTLYGRNSTAGSVLVSTNRPTKYFEGYVRMSGTSVGNYATSAIASGPLSDRLSARLALQYSNRDGFGTNTVTGRDAGGSEVSTGRLSLRYEPNGSITLDLIGEYQERSANPALIALTSVGETGVASPFVPREDLAQVLERDEFAFDDQSFTNSETYAITLSGQIDLGFAHLRTTTGYREWQQVGAQDSDSTALRLFNNEGSTSSHQFSQEFRLASKDDGRLSWLIGGYYLDEQTGLSFAIRNFQGLFRLGTQASYVAAQQTQTFAAFADFTYAINEQFSVTLGGRYSTEEKHFTNDQIVTIINGGTLPPFFLGGATLPAGAVFVDPSLFEDAASFDDYSPRAVISYSPGDNTLLYASYSHGFKSGGFNSFGLAPAFGSEGIDAFEIGLKSDLAQDRIRLNLAGFSYDYTNLQIRLPVPTGGVDIQNLGSAEIVGFELEGTAVVSDGLTLSANIAFLDTTISEGMIPAVFSGTPPIPIGAPLPLAPVDVTGNRLTRAPEFQGYANVRYQRPIGSLEAVASATYRYQSSVYYLETNQDASTFRNTAWDEVDIRVSLADPGTTWELAFFGQNIFDNRHITAVTALGGFPNAALNEPARWGLAATVRF